MERLRHIFLRSLRLAVLLFCATEAGIAAPAGIAAQEPDTLPLPPDSIRIPADTLAEEGEVSVLSDTLAPDTIPPPPRFPVQPLLSDTGWSAGAWSWDREALLTSGALTLTDLLERTPGVSPLRFGYLGLPEGVAAFGSTGGRIEFVLNGFVVDPLGSPQLDIADLEVANLEWVRVERRLDGLRVQIQTAAPVDRTPYSRVDAATGDFDTEAFRAVFLAPRAFFGPFTVGVEHVDTDGFAGAEPGNFLKIGGTWSYVSGSSGIQLEARRRSVDRGRLGLPISEFRQDLVLRGRTVPIPGLHLEAYGGISNAREENSEPAGEDTATENQSSREYESSQLGIRASLQKTGAWARSAVRYRTADELPSADFDLLAGALLLDRLGVEARVKWTGWRDLDATLSYGLRTSVRLIPAVEITGELAVGEQGHPNADSLGDPAFDDRRTYRVGAALDWRGVHAAGGGLWLQSDSIASFAPGDSVLIRPYPVEDLAGWEVEAGIPLFWGPLRAEGWMQQWMGDVTWAYLPGRAWRVGLVYRHSPLESGNLEIFGRVEHYSRGSMLAGEPGNISTGLTPLPPLDLVNGYLQVRVLTVRAFLRWENILNTGAQILPGRPAVPQRFLYGVKWEFQN